MTRATGKPRILKLTDAQVLEIFMRRKRGEKVLALACEFGISEAMVSKISFGTRRKLVINLSEVAK